MPKFKIDWHSLPQLFKIINISWLASLEIINYLALIIAMIEHYAWNYKIDCDEK